MSTDLARATTFFESSLPRLIRERGAAFDRTRGTLSIIVHGEGQWTITFGDHRNPRAVTRDVNLDADCVVAFSISTFNQLLDGALKQPPPALGDAKLLGRLGQLLVDPARGALGVRTGRVPALAASR